MSDPSTPPPGVYQPHAPRPSSVMVIGVINIALGALLLLWSLWAIASYIIMPYMSTFMEANMRQVEDQFEQDRQRELAELRTDLAAASTEEDKQAIRESIRLVEQQTPPPMPDFSGMMPQTNPTIMVWGVTFESLGLLLNLGMIASGVGLLMSRGWGRRLALWVAGLKIGRLVLGQGLYMIVCIPIYSRQMEAMMEQMSQVGPAGQGPPPGAFNSFGPMMGIFMAVQCVAMMVLGSIYPAIVLWLLNTSAVKAWFRSREAPT